MNPETDSTIYIEYKRNPLAHPDAAMMAESADGRFLEVTEAAAKLLRDAIGSVAVQLRPDLEKIGATKATVKLGAKLGMKNGKLTALITEVSVEGTLEVSIEFTAKP